MPRPKVSSEGKSPSASQDESGATTVDPMSELLATLTKNFEEVNMKFEKLGNKLEDTVKGTRNTNQRRAGLQHQAQQPRLAVKVDVLEDKKTCESREDFAQDGRLGDISSDRVHDPMRLTSFGDQDYTEPPALPCRDDALVSQGMKCQSRVFHPWKCASQHLPVAYYTPTQLLLEKQKGPIFPYNFFLGASERRTRRRIFVQYRHSPSTTVPGTQR